MRAATRLVCWVSMLISCVAPLGAQVVRESDASSVAGALAGVDGKAFDDFAFSSGGGDILYATIDAAIYQTLGAAEHDDHEGTLAVEEPGGCGGEDSGVGLCLQVLDATDQVVCWATRPRNPGWQRDPRLICLLPQVHGRPAEYRLRVALSDDDCADLIYPAPGAGDDVPYLLNVSLRRVATPGGLSPAVARSANKF